MTTDTATTAQQQPPAKRDRREAHRAYYIKTQERRRQLGKERYYRNREAILESKRTGRPHGRPRTVPPPPSP